MDINHHAPVVAHDQIVIDASPQQVWAILTDIDAWPAWQPGVSKAELLGALQPGSVFRWRAQGLGITSTLQDVEPARRISWTGEMIGTHAKHVWTLTPQGTGTLVETTESFEGWLARPLKGWMQRMLENTLRSGLAALRQRVEGRPAGSID